MVALNRNISAMANLAKWLVIKLSNGLLIYQYDNHINWLLYYTDSQVILFNVNGDIVNLCRTAMVA